MLGATLAWAWREGGRRVPPWMMVFSGMVYGALDEWHQSFVPGRDPALGDVVADGLGVLVGFGLLSSFFFFFRPVDRPDHSP